MVRNGAGCGWRAVSHCRDCFHCCAWVWDRAGNVEFIRSVVLQVSLKGLWQVRLCWARWEERRYRNLGVVHVLQWWRLYAERKVLGMLLRLMLGCVMRRWVRMALGMLLGAIECVDVSGVHWHSGQGGWDVLVLGILVRVGSSPIC